jgi:hypothetical protein
LVEVPGEWADAVLSLVKISNEHRHNGLIVTNIGSGSQGARAGIARGDVLLRCDGVELDSPATLSRLAQRHTQGAEVSKTMTIDAARGSTDMTFEVARGLFGITVTPSLHRLKPVHLSQIRPPEAYGKEVGALGTIAVIDRSLVPGSNEARRYDPGAPMLVEVPGELGRKVLFLVKMLDASAPVKTKKRARALLLSARPKRPRP